MLTKLFRKVRPHLPRVALFAALLAPGGYAAYSELSGGDCCYPGAPCCHPGSPCCAHASK